MSSDRLRDALALLLRENHRHTTSLSADAERTIRRRVGWLWAGRVGVLVAVATLGTAAVGAYGSWGSSDRAIRNPIPTPTIGVAPATFPVEGGPEFVSAAAGLTCGDPAPEPHPEEHDVALTVTATNALYHGGPIEDYDALPAAQPHLSQNEGTELGVLANSAIFLIIERD
ncbi:MAG: hypothetical protein HGA51_09660, partial [Demequinaceae bacterium]|nr:hypothetical protein [Demequinaceae bacterium]